MADARNNAEVKSLLESISGKLGAVFSDWKKSVTDDFGLFKDEIADFKETTKDYFNATPLGSILNKLAGALESFGKSSPAPSGSGSPLTIKPEGQSPLVLELLQTINSAKKQPDTATTQRPSPMPERPQVGASPQTIIDKLTTVLNVPPQTGKPEQGNWQFAASQTTAANLAAVQPKKTTLTHPKKTTVAGTKPTTLAEKLDLLLPQLKINTERGQADTEGGRNKAFDEDCCREIVRLLSSILNLMPTASPNWPALLSNLKGQGDQQLPKPQKSQAPEGFNFEQYKNRVNRFLGEVGSFANSAMASPSAPERGVAAAGRGIQSASAMAGPAAPAVWTFGKLVETVGASVAAVKEWNTSLRISDMQLAEFSASMAQVVAEAQVRDIFRTQRMGEALAPSAREREESYSQLKEAMMPMQIAWDQSVNGVLTEINKTMSGIFNWLNTKLGLSTAVVNAGGLTFQTLFDQAGLGDADSPANFGI